MKKTDVKSICLIFLPSVLGWVLAGNYVGIVLVEVYSVRAIVLCVFIGWMIQLKMD